MKVRLEPIGEELECGPEETVLDAAFRAGYNLVHGCREGQCSACKCFLLEGDVALKPHSSFALSESEESSGYSLMCRAMPESDLVVELLHFDPEAIRLENPIRDVEATVEAIEPHTHDIAGVRLRVPEDFGFVPGQYVDVHVPGSDVRRSFSIANLPGEGRIELIVKRYPGGRLSGMLGTEIVAGTELTLTGPYGALRLHGGEAPILMVAGGSGMAPVLGILRQLARDGCERPVRFYFGARTEADLFLVEEVRRLGAQLADFRFTPVTERFVHEVVDEGWELERPDVYTCGPPPMIEALEGVLARRGVDPDRVFADRFTTSADAVPPATAAAAEDPREFAWYQPAGRRRTLYEDVTVDTQPSVHRHLTRDWPLRFADGRGTWDDGSTELRARDWFAFRDPAGQWERPYYEQGTALERSLDLAVRAAVQDGLLDDMSDAWREHLRRHGQAPAFVEHGLWFALATAGRACLSDTVATCVCLQAAMKQRSAQALVLAAMDLEPHLGPLPIEPARDAFLGEEAWQAARELLERLAATEDWGEVVVAVNLCFEPTVGTLLRRELGIRAATLARDTITPVAARAATEEWHWAQAWTQELVRFLLEDAEHGERNRAVIARWTAAWLPACEAAARALAPVLDGLGIDGSGAADRVAAEAEGALSAAGERVSAPARRARAPRPRPAASTVTAADGYDYVGIVMAKSAEGDAVAAILGQRDEVEVLEQPSFWDIRARERMRIPYEEISAALGYEIDAYSIQHEMSTHYGRLVAADDALMLFSDPSEAMEHLLR